MCSFWLTIANPLYPVKLAIANIPTDGTNPMQSVEKTFQITRADKELFSKQEYDVQAWCMLLNDKVPFRMQWPQYADLQVNGTSINGFLRLLSNLLLLLRLNYFSTFFKQVFLFVLLIDLALNCSGLTVVMMVLLLLHVLISPCIKDGINKITLTGCDARVFCFGVRIVKRRTVQQILNTIPKENDGERLEDALCRVRRCVGGGTATDNGDSDSDLEVVADFFGVNLRCPMSGSRMKVAGRFKPCVHMGCFDLEVFVELNQRSRKASYNITWQCPICLKNYSLEHIIIDPYFNRITSKMSNCGEDITEIEVKPDGSWRAKAKSENERRELGDLALWHSPDSTLCESGSVEDKPTAEISKQIKLEGTSEGQTGLKLGIKKNQNGYWQFSKPEDLNNSSASRLQDRLRQQKLLPMSSSATGSGKDGEDASVNQDAGGTYDFTSNGIELDSVPLNVDSAYEFTDQNKSATGGNAEVIVLSDSDEENELLISPPTVYKDNHNQNDGGGLGFPVAPPGISHPYSEEPPLGPAANLGLFTPNAEFDMPLWSLPSGSQDGSGFQLFNTDPDVADTLVDLQRSSLNCPSTINGYPLAPETTMGSTTVVPACSIGQVDTNLNDSLVDTTLFGGEDPSLQIFLPTHPSGASAESGLRDQADVSNGIRTDDWISLRLGGGASGGHGDSTTVNGLNSRQPIPSKDRAMDTASLLLGMNDSRNGKSSRQRTESPFSFPRQKRSVRPRLYLSIDSDTE
ncbi:E3 SUMO-protein ligase SIZ1-like isoform X1 [Gossypium australe]|uniref:E3 SUMO-protein ligase SIZ1-like isoform X1 n=1 Tax=Gossypium australe TaxID=47621 RepID=A0A5B6WXN9_9ROSI|nr:E3 SUMO-protein ligase SIZ1-like isoform X1 [Gossypium australe]